MVVFMTPTDSMFFAIGLPIILGAIAGGCTALLTNWVQVKFLRELEYRLADCEGRVNRETKIRAQEKSVSARKGSDDLVEWAKENAAQPNVAQMNLADWRKSKMLGATPK